MLDARITVPSTVVFRQFPAETVILNLETGLYHGVNAVGGRMLEVLEKTGSVRETAATVAKEYNVPQERVEGDLVQLCEDLVSRGILIVQEPDTA